MAKFERKGSFGINSGMDNLLAVIKFLAVKKPVIVFSGSHALRSSLYTSIFVIEIKVYYVGWVERSETHRNLENAGFRYRSTQPTF